MIANDAAQPEPLTSRPSGHVCPWWFGYFLCCPLRRLLESPEALLGPHVRPGMTVLEPGCGMGYFSVPLARMVGPTGRVLCLDVQPRMVAALLRRARRAGVTDRIEAAVCPPGGLGIERWAARVDLAVAIHMVHEVQGREGFLGQLHAALRPGGRLFLLEPRGHVSRANFDATIAAAARVGFARIDSPGVSRGLAALLAKRESGV